MIWWPIEVPTLHYGLLTLRPSRDSDIEPIYQACQDPLISRFTTVPRDYTMAHASDFVRKDRTSLAEKHEIRFVIEYGVGDDAIFVGVISLHSVDIANHCAAIGYWMVHGERGKGIATKAAKVITDYGFTTLGLRRIEGLVDSDNVASCKLLISAGYTTEALLRHKVTRESGLQIDMVLLAALAKEWQPLDI